MTIDQQHADITLEIATDDEMKTAIMFGRLVSRDVHTTVYSYNGKYYILSDEPLLGETR